MCGRRQTKVPSDSLNMLDQRVNETRGGQIPSFRYNFNQNEKGCFTTDPRPPEHSQAVSKKNTVKELLKMTRKVSQRWNRYLNMIKQV